MKFRFWWLNGFLKPLGNPADNAVKFFALVTLEELKADPKWLHRARASIYEYWRIKNAGRAAANIKCPSRLKTRPSVSPDLFSY